MNKYDMLVATIDDDYTDYEDFWVHCYKYKIDYLRVRVLEC